MEGKIMDWGILLGIVGVLGIPLALAVLGLTMAATTPGEYRFVRGCFFAAGAISAATIFPLFWNYTEGSHTVRITALALVGALIFGGLGVALDWVNKKQEGAQQSGPNPLVAGPQFEEIQSLQKFLAGKDENGLRQLFDFQSMLALNIQMFKDKVPFIQQGKPDDFSTGPYLQPPWQQSLASTKIGRWTITPGGPRIEGDADQIVLIVFTQKYQIAVAELIKFQNSGLLPNQIIEPIAKLAEAVNNNAELMLLTLNEKFREDFQFFTRHDEYVPPYRYYGVVASTYLVSSIH
jgi:hypothetical protein